MINSLTLMTHGIMNMIQATEIISGYSIYPNAVGAWTVRVESDRYIPEKVSVQRECRTIFDLELIRGDIERAWRDAQEKT